jgi:hypothetical protein
MFMVLKQLAVPLLWDDRADLQLADDARQHIGLLPIEAGARDAKIERGVRRPCLLPYSYGRHTSSTPPSS